MSLSNRFTELLHQAIGAKKLTTKETARAAKETGRTQAEQTMLSDKNQERALQYNTVIIKLIREGKLPYDSIQIPVDKKVKRFTSELVLPRPNQIKSAELIVTDSQGNIVLPSARFDPSDKSILHSSFEAIHSDITVSPERVSRVQSLADQAIKAIPLLSLCPSWRQRKKPQMYLKRAPMRRLLLSCLSKMGKQSPLFL